MHGKNQQLTQISQLSTRIHKLEDHNKKTEMRQSVQKRSQSYVGEIENIRSSINKLNQQSFRLSKELKMTTGQAPTRGQSLARMMPSQSMAGQTTGGTALGLSVSSTNELYDCDQSPKSLNHAFQIELMNERKMYG